MDLPGVPGTLGSFLQCHSSKASILRCSAFFIGQLSYSYMTTGKTIALTRQTFVGKVIFLFFNGDFAVQNGSQNDAEEVSGVLNYSVGEDS